MSVDPQYMANWVPVSSCAQEQTQQWVGGCSVSPQAAPMSPEWPSPPAMQSYPVSYPMENMRVPMYHPSMDQGYPQQPTQEHNFMWSKTALENQCQGYLSFSAHNQHASTVARRNERERNRVRHINSTFENLRQHLPCNNKKKKLSKVDTLRNAIKYIKHLQNILGDDEVDVKSTIKALKSCTNSLSSSTTNKRQSLDSSVHSTSSVEAEGVQEEDEIVASPGETLTGSPCSNQPDTPAAFLLRQQEDNFSWPSS